ncbi:MAG: bifunctional glutamate N-acetyltransferase/amino-acid acetyltransferase ArgJ, partial [Pseudomonadales bacterium]|nr:bifunctional glutamate N-acetyltransferase/amino-acid acetyltransferase ArgJ [Pseudomonadales bacterium]
PGRRDLVVIELAPGNTSAGLFTRNAFCAAPVQIARDHLKRGAPRYWVINTGNANAGTGAAGLAAAHQVCTALAAAAGVAVDQVLPFSTGVIGEPLPVERIVAALPAALAALDGDGWPLAAEGILTTDTRAKGASRLVHLAGGTTLTVTGIAKGAGMIRPNMATMLAFVATDAHLPAPRLQGLLEAAAARSFNRITIDGDTSTNDALMLAATGAVDRELDEPAIAALGEAIAEVCTELAQAIVRDGEGATKFVTVRVEGGADSTECLQVAYAVAESPLVKTALFASDPNWGRILAAVGRAGIEGLDVARVNLWLDDVLIAERGARAEAYTEADGQRVMDREEITIRIQLGRGASTETVWTTDLSHDYVRINAEYRS